MIAPNINPENRDLEQSSNPETSPSGDVRQILDTLWQDGKEIAEYFRHYITAQRDSLMLRLRTALFVAVVAVTVLIAAIVSIAVATVLVLVGLSDGIAASLGDRAWLGRLIVGVSVLAIAAGSSSLGIVLWLRFSRKRTICDYEYRHLRQRAIFGRDVHNAAQKRTAAG